METRKYYYEDSHRTEMTATVLSCEEGKKGFEVVLSGTVFFPEGGGQSADTGVFYISEEETVSVLDVHERNGIIYHTTDQPVEPGTELRGEIDWNERFSKMQNHSGEHLVSGIIHRLFQYNNVGFHLGSTDVTIDFDGPLTREQLNQVEQMANEAVFLNLPVLEEFPDREHLATMEYRSKTEISGQVRIVTIPGYDCCACCAPHVKTTGEIGIIKFLDAVSYKGGMRVHMLCGRRAVLDYESRYEAVARISALLSAKQAETPEAVAHMKEEVKGLKEEISGWKQALIGEKLLSLAEGEDPLCFFEDRLSGDELRKLIDGAARKRTGLCIGFHGTEGSYQFVMAGQKGDMRTESKAFLAAVGGRGGGTARMAQGMVTARRADVEAYFSTLKVQEL